jgi:hypothetical protein
MSSSVASRAARQGIIQEHVPKLSRRCGLTQGSHGVANGEQVPANRQRRREWDDESTAKRGEKRREGKGEECFADLRRWVLTTWRGAHPWALAGPWGRA